MEDIKVILNINEQNINGVVTEFKILGDGKVGLTIIFPSFETKNLGGFFKLRPDTSTLEIITDLNNIGEIAKKLNK